MAAPYQRPAWARRMAAMGPGVGGAANLVPLDADELIAAACRATGLDDFGPSTWEEPFRRLVAALDGEAQLHALGRLLSRHDALRHLCTRLRVIDALARDPGIADEPITAPVFVTGPARSGTSILHELLGQDPRLRAPLAWEMAYPFPPADGDDQRPQWAEPEFDLWGDVQPEFNAVHELAAALPEECLWLMAPEFDATFWTTCTNVPSFLMWRVQTDPEPVYRFHKLMLQVLQRGHEPRPWVLKSPVHMGRLPALFRVYPDARIVHTHRDPARAVPSTISTLVAGRFTRSEAVDGRQIAAAMGYGLRHGHDAVIGLRAAGTIPDAQIADLHYLDLLREPVAAVGRACERLGLDLDDAQAARIRSYLDARPQDKHGVHRYRATDFGLDVHAIRGAYRTYTDHYGIELEEV